MRLSIAALLVSASALVNGHFLLNYPQTRGFDEDNEGLFCGGFATPSSNRSQFPLSNGIVSITSAHPKSHFLVAISFNEDPTKFSDFNTSSDGSKVPFLVPFIDMNAQGDACVPVNVSALSLPQAKDGANATIMVQFNGGDGDLFQCADVILSSNAAVPSGTKCDNVTGAFPTSSATSPAGTNGNSTTPTSGVTEFIIPVLVAGGAGLTAALFTLF